MKRKIFIIVALAVNLLILFQTGNLLAQETPSYSQYMFNKFILNPAVAGSEGYTAYNLTSHEQWLGFKDAPMTNALSAQTRLIKNRFTFFPARRRVRYKAPEYGHVGIGVHIFNDHRGLLNQTSLQFTYAYHEKIDLKEQLSFGLTFGLTQFRVNGDKMVLYETENYLGSGNLSVFIPDFNAGVYFTSEQMYLGAAASQLMQSALRFGNTEGNGFKLLRNYNFMGGYRFSVLNDFSMEPSYLLKLTNRLVYQLDAGCRIYYKRDFWGGLAYRTGKVLIMSVGMRTNDLYFGYAYDYSFNSLQTYSIGTHELMVSLKFGENVRKYKWIERF